jgi:hypothetical protein
VRVLMARIHAAPHPDAGTANEEALGAEVRVTLDTGEVIAKKVGAALGRGPDNPLPAGALAMKFVNCAGRALPAPSVARLQRMLETLETTPSIKALVAAIVLPKPIAAE